MYVYIYISNIYITYIYIYIYIHICFYKEYKEINRLVARSWI